VPPCAGRLAVGGLLGLAATGEALAAGANLPQPGREEQPSGVGGCTAEGERLDAQSVGCVECGVGVGVGAGDDVRECEGVGEARIADETSPSLAHTM
jgi:hypothetical protein